MAFQDVQVGQETQDSSHAGLASHASAGPGACHVDRVAYYVGQRAYQGPLAFDLDLDRAFLPWAF